jgi:Raf kinase inhibitor-like YbhB/YbcL family protein
MTFILTSAAFEPGGPIPARLTCEGADASPPLEWSGAPPLTRSFALLLEDPDAPDPKAPKTTWVHWVLYNIPATTTGLPEGGATNLPAGTLDGVNDWKRTGYGGPCPPIGRHRYVHRLFALDVVLPDLVRPSRARLLAAMDGHVLGVAQLIGTYRQGG